MAGIRNLDSLIELIINDSVFTKTFVKLCSSQERGLASPREAEMVE
jgi:hypothetical protein